jgi:hypothetical protein
MNIVTQLYRYKVDDTTSNEQKAKIEQRHLEYNEYDKQEGHPGRLPRIGF